MNRYLNYQTDAAAINSLGIAAKTKIGDLCRVLSIAQIYADCFVSRQFRQTATNAGRFLM